MIHILLIAYCVFGKPTLTQSVTVPEITEPTCYHIDNVPDCRYFWSDVIIDRRCTNDPKDRDGNRLNNTAGDLTLFKTYYNKTTSSGPIETCVLGELNPGPIFKCKIAAGDSGALEKEFVRIAGSKANMVFSVPIIDEETPTMPCTSAEISMMSSWQIFDYKVEAMLGQSYMFSVPIGTTKVGIRGSVSKVRITTEGKSDPRRQYYGILDIRPFLDRIEEQDINGPITDKKMRYMHRKGQELLNTRRIHKREAPSSLAFATAPNVDQCKKLSGWVNQYQNLNSLSCTSLKERFGDGFWLCRNTEGTVHCNIDESGPYEDGGWHKVCAKSMQAWVQAIASCGIQAVQEAVLKGDQKMLGLLSKFSKLDANTDSLVRSNNELSKELKRAVSTSLSSLVEFGKSLFSAQNSLNEFRSKIGGWANITDARIRANELRSLKNEFNINALNKTQTVIINQIFNSTGVLINVTRTVFDSDGEVTAILNAKYNQSLFTNQNDSVFRFTGLQTNALAIRRTQARLDVKFWNISKQFDSEIEAKTKLRAEIDKQISDMQSEIKAELKAIKESMNKAGQTGSMAVERSGLPFVGMKGVTFGSIIGVMAFIFLAIVAMICCMCFKM